MELSEPARTPKHHACAKLNMTRRVLSGSIGNESKRVMQPSQKIVLAFDAWLEILAIPLERAFIFEPNNRGSSHHKDTAEYIMPQQKDAKEHEHSLGLQTRYKQHIVM